MKKFLSGAVLSLLLISGCSSTVTGAASYADAAQATDIQTDQTTSESDDTDTDTTTKTTTTTTTTETDEPTTSSADDSGDKPTKDEVYNAVLAFLAEGGVPPPTENIAACITDAIYEPMSADGLETLVQEGADGKVNDADYAIMEAAVEDCVASS